MNNEYDPWFKNTGMTFYEGFKDPVNHNTIYRNTCVKERKIQPIYACLCVNKARTEALVLMHDPC